MKAIAMEGVDRLAAFRTSPLPPGISDAADRLMFEIAPTEVFGNWDIDPTGSDGEPDDDPDGAA